MASDNFQGCFQRDVCIHIVLWILKYMRWMVSRSRFVKVLRIDYSALIFDLKSKCYNFFYLSFD